MAVNRRGGLVVLQRIAAPLVVLCSMTTPFVIEAQGSQDVQVAASHPTLPHVTVKATNALLRAVLAEVARQAGLTLAYQDDLVPTSARVTVDLQDVAVPVAFAQTLAGTGAVAVLASGNRAVIVSAHDVRTSRTGSGIIAGHVFRAGTNDPVVGASVRVYGPRPDSALVFNALTDQHGAYLVSNLHAGTYQIVIRKLGMTVERREVAVLDDKTTAASFQIAASATQLTEMVTTGSGDRQRFTVGNAVATINADSVVQNTPLRNLSDLLNGRVPGMNVQSQSGQVGTGSRIRIRGLSSLVTGEDPIVIVDGVRVDASYSHSTFATAPGTASPGSNQATSQATGSVPASSRLNDIDINSIESIDVLRGPAASTLYGSDAANGVIVIKTKHGKPGPTRWALTANWGRSSLGSLTFPDSYYGWGTQPNGIPYGSGSCALINVSRHQCVQDSVTSFNPLNVPGVSPFTDGHSQMYSGQVSGGSQALQYFVGGSYGNQGGILTFPDQLQAAFVKTLNGNSLPGWAINPNSFNDLHLTSTLTTQLAQQVDLSLTSMAERSHQLASTQGAGGIVNESYLSPGYRDTLTLGWGSSDPFLSFLTRNSNDIARTTGSASGTWHPGKYFSANATGGVDYSVLDDQSLLPTTLVIPNLTGASFKNRTTNEQTVQNANLGTTLSLPWRALWFRTSLGGQYVSNALSNVQANASGLVSGTQTINGASTVTAAEFSSAVKTAGWYLNEEVDIQQRLFLTVAMREDRSSAFGSAAKPVAYPKFNASWLVSQEPFFPNIPGLSSLRLRGAFGQAGAQPDVTARSLTYQTPLFSLQGTPTYVTNTIGNPALVPERSQEIEGGFDLSLGEDRFTFEATTYHKITKDALVNVTLPPSAGVANETENIGQLSNSGLELAATLRPIDNRMMTWSSTLGYSKNTNRVDALGTATLTNGLWGRYAVGYPVDGVWSRAIVSAQDLNHNGILDPSELLLTDSLQYAGSGSPSGQFNWHNSVGLWSGRVTVSASLAYTGTMTQINGQLQEQCSFGHCQGAVDPHASLALQALALASSGQGVIWPFLEQTSVLRFDEFTLSFIAPNGLSRAFHAQSATISLMGRNLGMWTHYRGADPTVNAPGRNTTTGIAGDEFADYGGVPQPREWSLNFHISY